MHNLPLMRETTGGYEWGSLTKGQWCEKSFRIMASSWQAAVEAPALSNENAQHTSY